MSAKDRTPTTRFLAFAAILLAAGVFALRAHDLFAAPKSDPIGSALERELTYLLEPIAGAERVRVAGTMGRPKTVLVMIDGAPANDLRGVRAQVESILIAAMGFNVETDSLTLSQFPFAHGVNGSLTALEIAELTGLGVLILVLLGASLTPQRAQATPSSVAETGRIALQAPTRAQLPAPKINAPSELNQAEDLAETKPVETAGLVRGWMSYAED